MDDPVNRDQSPISTVRARPVSAEMPRRQPSRSASPACSSAAVDSGCDRRAAACGHRSMDGRFSPRLSDAAVGKRLKTGTRSHARSASAASSSVAARHGPGPRRLRGQCQSGYPNTGAVAAVSQRRARISYARDRQRFRQTTTPAATGAPLRTLRRRHARGRGADRRREPLQRLPTETRSDRIGSTRAPVAAREWRYSEYSQGVL